jgi:YidC/Oxa1 family membrane protein insertase
MRKSLGRARLAMKESNDMGKLLTMSSGERAVVVYAEDTFSHIQLKGYLEALWADHGQPYQYVTSDPEDPLLASPPTGGSSWFIRDQLARFMSNLECEVFITTMPDLGMFHVPRPKAGRTVYAFHSLNSTHSAYRDGAFEHYDQFLCTGPHHVAELSVLRSGRPPVLSETGYYKLDLIREEYRTLQSGSGPDDDLVVVAPSWGRQNVLESVGSEVIASLRRADLRVIVRPHPQFFHTLYLEGQAVMAQLVNEFGDDPGVEFEMNIGTQHSFIRSSLMISDWSGAAYEFSLGTLRPVLFVDTPQKTFNENWQGLGLPSFERSMRDEVGRLVAMEDADGVGTLATRMIETSPASASHLDELAQKLVFNVGGSASAGARAIAAMM